MLVKRELSKNMPKLDIDGIKKQIAKKTKRMLEWCVESKKQIVKHSFNVFRYGMTILIHSQSECVLSVLKSASDRGIRVSVITTDSLPSNTGEYVHDICKDL